MRPAALVVGIALLLRAGAWAWMSRAACLRVLSGPLASADPRRRLAALAVLDDVVLDDRGLREWAGPLAARAGAEPDPWVSDVLASVVVRHQGAGLPRTEDAVDLLLWATRELEDHPGPLPPDPEVEAMAVDLKADLALAARRSRPRLGPCVFALVALVLLVQLVAGAGPVAALRSDGGHGQRVGVAAR